jgi:hypothetical protein
MEKSILSPVICVTSDGPAKHPPHADGTTHQDGHGFCLGGHQPPWGDEVLAFLAEAMRTPPAP